jgi:NTE family protein
MAAEDADQRPSAQGRAMDSRLGAADVRARANGVQRMSRALVLSGGGPMGFAWESGLIAGFAQGGVDFGEADFILGTSAGAIAGARLASGLDPAGLAEAVIAADLTGAPPLNRGSPEIFARMMALMGAAQESSRHPAEARREIGALALAAEGAGAQDEFIAVMARELGELPGPAWPSRTRYACSAVDAEDGGFQLWEAGSGVELVRAVASSCCVPGMIEPIAILGRRYMDGGMRSPTNADLAAGHDVVVVISVVPERSGAGRLLEEEVESLKAGGSTVITVAPDDGSLAALGTDLMDLARRPGAARAGVAQGLAQAEVLRDYWL